MVHAPRFAEDAGQDKGSVKANVLARVTLEISTTDVKLLDSLYTGAVTDFQKPPCDHLTTRNVVQTKQVETCLLSFVNK